VQKVGHQIWETLAERFSVLERKSTI
jgi:hypothetical protein